MGQPQSFYHENLDRAGARSNDSSFMSLPLPGGEIVLALVVLLIRLLPVHSIIPMLTDMHVNGKKLFQVRDPQFNHISWLDAL